MHHPSLAVTLHSGSHSAILAAVQQRKADVGVQPDVPGNPRFRRQPVLHQRVAAFASACSGLTKVATMPLADRVNWPLIFGSRC